MPALVPFRAFLRRFRKREDGIASIEAILWIPIFFWLLMLILDVSYVYFERSQALRMIQDVNRGYSVGRYKNETEATAAILAAIQTLAPTAQAQTSYDSTTGLITTKVNMRADELMPIGAVRGLGSNFTIGLSAQHYMES